VITETPFKPQPRRSPLAWPAVPLALLCGALLLGAAAPAQAGWFDNLFGPSTPSSSPQAVTPADAKQRLWRLGDFSKIEIVAREAGAPENQQPVTVSSELLFQQLALVQETTQGGPRRPLFDGGELAILVGPLAQALERAGPGDDILVLSSVRRSGLLLAPTAVTARVFVRDGRLQLIVHDAHFEFYDAWRGTNIPPTFVYGTRAEASKVALQSSQATSARTDWLAIPLTAPVATAPAAAPAPAVMPAAPAMMPAAPAAVAPAPMPAPVAAPPARPPLDKAGAEEIERRLETLKRLREKNLITEDEYQQKRKEILQLL
jgi:hypothetical protein